MSTNNLIKKSLGFINLESGQGLPSHSSSVGSIYFDTVSGYTHTFRNNSWVENSDTYEVPFIHAASFSPADNTTYYLSIIAASTTDTSAGYGYQVPFNSYLIGASLNNNFTAGSSGFFVTGGCRDSSNGTDILDLFTNIDLSTAGNNNGYHVTGLTQFISGGTRISIYLKCPGWTPTNPTGWRPSVILTLVKA